MHLPQHLHPQPLRSHQTRNPNSPLRAFSKAHCLNLTAHYQSNVERPPDETVNEGQSNVHSRESKTKAGDCNGGVAASRKW